MVLLWVYRAAEIKKNLLAKITADSLPLQVPAFVPRSVRVFVSYITPQDGRLPSQQFNMLLLSFARRVTETPSVAEVLFS